MRKAENSRYFSAKTEPKVYHSKATFTTTLKGDHVAANLYLADTYDNNFAPRFKTQWEHELIQIQSVQIGQVVTVGDPQSTDIANRQWTSAFDKKPVEGLVTVTTTGITNDAVADTRFHGGPDKALLCYAHAHYGWWQAEYPELSMTGGAFGENLTVTEASEASICIGDVFDVGTCQLQVSQPRQPCWKISRRWGIKTLTKKVTQTGRTGWYVRVLSEGTLSVGDPLHLVDRPHEKWTIERANHFLFGREFDRMAAFELMNLPELADAWKADIP